MEKCQGEWILNKIRTTSRKYQFEEAMRRLNNIIIGWLRKTKQGQSRNPKLSARDFQTLSQVDKPVPPALLRKHHLIVDQHGLLVPAPAVGFVTGKASSSSSPIPSASAASRSSSVELVERLRKIRKINHAAPRKKRTPEAQVTEQDIPVPAPPSSSLLAALLLTACCCPAVALSAAF